MGWSPGETLSFPVLQKKKGNKRFFYAKVYLCLRAIFFKFWNCGAESSYGSNGNVTQSANCAITLSTWSRNLGRVVVFAPLCPALAHPVSFWRKYSPFLTMPGRKVYVVGVGMTKVSDEISFMCKSGPIWSYVKCHDPAAMMSQLAIKWTRLNPIVIYRETMFSSLKSLADEKILIILIWLKKQVCSFVPFFCYFIH